MAEGFERAERLEREAARERVNSIIRQHHGLAKTAMLTAAGVSYKMILTLVERGELVRAKSGYYTLPDVAFSEEEAILSRFGDGILTMGTALYYHGYFEERPAVWSIAVSKNISKSKFKLSDPPVQPYFCEESVLSLGVETVDFAGEKMKIYTADRLICDVLKYHNRLSEDDYRKAILAYIDDENKNVEQLWAYATERRVLRRAENILGTWIGGMSEKRPVVKPHTPVRKTPPEKEDEIKEAEAPAPVQEIEHEKPELAVHRKEITGDASVNEIAHAVFAILRQMELIEDMGVFVELYELLQTKAVDGMAVSRRLMDICEDEDFVPDEMRVKKIHGWSMNRFMEQKWEKYLRRQNNVSLSWFKVIEKLSTFIVPIGLSMVERQPFIGDWMPEIGRFLE